MLLEMKCKVESTTEVPSPYHFSFDQKDVSLLPVINEEGRSVIGEITMRKRIPREAQFRAAMVPPAPGETEAQFVVQGTDEIEDELKEDLQFLESLLSLSMVMKIRWESPDRSFIPENAAEKLNLGMYSLREWEVYPKIYMPLRVHLLDHRISKLRELTVPLAFFREGESSFQEFNYISSFQNLYFVVEGFYAEGESRDQDKRFVSNEELLGYTRAAFPQIMQIKDKLQPFFTFYKLDMTPESFLKLAVKIRHRVHHYFHGGESEEYFGNPLNQEYYEPMALALIILCGHILFGKIEGLRS
jgi:hypothetical protein